MVMAGPSAPFAGERPGNRGSAAVAGIEAGQRDDGAAATDVDAGNGGRSSGSGACAAGAGSGRDSGAGVGIGAVACAGFAGTGGFAGFFSRLFIF